MSATDTGELMALAQTGDIVARDQLLMRHRDRLRRMIGLYLDPRLSARIDASDVLQEALAQAARKLNAYLAERPIAFYPWLREIVRETLIDIHRRHVSAKRRSVTVEQAWGGSLDATSGVHLAEQLVRYQASPSQHVSQRELVEKVRLALQSLPALDRDLVTMRWIEQMSFVEISQVTEISPSTAKSRVRRALQRLAHIVGDV